MFIDLYRGLGDIAFRQGLRNLYLLSQQDGASVGMNEVKTAFKADGAGIAAPIVDRMVARWYDGSVPYDTSARDTTPYDPSFRTINGSITEAYISTAQEGPRLSSSGTTPLGDSLWLYLEYHYTVSSDTEVPLEIVTYFERWIRVQPSRCVIHCTAWQVRLVVVAGRTLAKRGLGGWRLLGIRLQ